MHVLQFKQTVKKKQDYIHITNALITIKQHFYIFETVSFIQQYNQCYTLINVIENK